MLSPAQVRALKEAGCHLSIAQLHLQAAIAELQSNGIDIEPRPQGFFELKCVVEELLQRDVVQRAGAVPD